MSTIAAYSVLKVEFFSSRSSSSSSSAFLEVLPVPICHRRRVKKCYLHHLRWQMAGYGRQKWTVPLVFNKKVSAQ